MARLDRAVDPVLAPSATRARTHTAPACTAAARCGGCRGAGRAADSSRRVRALGLVALRRQSERAGRGVSQAKTGIDASGDDSAAPQLRDQADNPAAGVADHAVAVRDGARRRLRAPVMRRGRPAPVLASHPHIAVVAPPVAPGESHLIAAGDKMPSAHPDRSAAARVDADLNPGTGLLLTAPTVEPRFVVAAVRGHDVATERPRGPWAETGQRAASSVSPPGRAPNVPAHRSPRSLRVRAKRSRRASDAFDSFDRRERGFSRARSLGQSEPPSRSEWESSPLAGCTSWRQPPTPREYGDPNN